MVVIEIYCDAVVILFEFGLKYACGGSFFEPRRALINGSASPTFCVPTSVFPTEKGSATACSNIQVWTSSGFQVFSRWHRIPPVFYSVANKFHPGQAIPLSVSFTDTKCYHLNSHFIRSSFHLIFKHYIAADLYSCLVGKQTPCERTKWYGAKSFESWGFDKKYRGTRRF